MQYRSTDKLLKLSSDSPLFILLIILTFVVVTLSAWLSPKPLVIKEFGLNDIVQLLTLPFFISLLLERSLEVFITTWRGPTAEQLDITIQQQNTLISKQKTLLQEQQIKTPADFGESTQVSGLPPEGMSLEQQIIQNYIQNQEPFKKTKLQIDDLNNLINELNINERKRASYKSDTRIIALWTSLLFGLLMSAIGIRSIEPLVITDASNPMQVIIFRCLDALLTGGLIAGGSEGIHRFIQVFVDFMEATSQQIKDRRLP